MIDKIASANWTADKGMDLILAVSMFSKSIRNLASDPSRENLDDTVKKANELERAFDVYKTSALESVEEITSDEEVLEITSYTDDKGNAL